LIDSPSCRSVVLFIYEEDSPRSECLLRPINVYICSIVCILLTSDDTRDEYRFRVFFVVTASSPFRPVSGRRERFRIQFPSFLSFSPPLSLSLSLSLCLSLHFPSKLLSAGEHSGATKLVRMDVLTVLPGPAIKGRLQLNPRWICRGAYVTIAHLFILLSLVKLLNKSHVHRYRGKS